jgi:Uma2 family endonuclease
MEPKKETAQKEKTSKETASKETIQKDKRYTYADYLTWGDDVRYELIDGEPFLMFAPSTEHQKISSELHGQLWTFLKGKPCKPFSAPIDVRLNHKKGDDMVMKPDILVVCDKSKIDKKSINGAPDFIIEILSPANPKHDLIIKLGKYMQAGVREYWVIDPERKMVFVNILKDGLYSAGAYDGNVTAVPVSVLEGCSINLKDVFSA